MHSDVGTRVDPSQRLAEGTFVRGTVVCHHAFGIGVHIEGADQYGHVDVPFISDGAIRGVEDYPRLGQAISGVVIRYDGHGQLRLTTRLHDLPGYRGP